MMFELPNSEHDMYISILSQQLVLVPLCIARG